MNYLLIALILVGLVYVFSIFQEFSYFSLSKDYTEIGTMLLRPLDYHDGQVCTAGKYTTGEGISVITDAQNPTGAIWVSAPVEQSLFSMLWSKYISREPKQTFIAKVCGVFEMTESKTQGFGPNNQYQYQITSGR